jgi:uncharacterized membrane protein
MRARTGGTALNRLAMALAVVGGAVAVYLTWVHYDAGMLVCGLGDCHMVQASEFATIGRVPIAVLGLAMYLMALLANLLLLSRPEYALPATALAFAVTLAGTIYAAYLTWLEVAVIGAICQWCVGSAILTTALAAIEGFALWRLIAVPLGAEGETGTDRTAY